MRYFLLCIFGASLLHSATVVKVDKMFAKSSKCKSCHLPIVNEWKNSWHSKSHYKNDEYLRKSIDYVSKKSRKSLNGVKIDCATCHNPRVAVTSSGMDYEIDALMGLDKDSKVNKALASDAISEGINCVVCHNIDKIHKKKPESIRGINRIEWTKSGLMSGPYKDAHSPYHKVQYRDFMSKDSNNLCFVCHANDRSIKKLTFINMKKEFAGSKKLCVECHMGKKKLGVASTLKIDHGKAKKRKIRVHSFKGAHFEDMVKDSLALEVKQNKATLMIILKNKLPHNVPSGFGSREVVIDLVYFSKTKILKKESISLTRHYTDRRKRPTIAHLAKKQSKDMSIKAYSQKVLKVKAFKGANMLKVILSYRLVNDEVRDLLKLQDPIWSQKMPISHTTIKLN